jgi:putative nucleotidyltransferase with HDIG domain
MALVSAVEAKDPYTSGHSRRVTAYSMRLAEKLDLAGERLKLLEQAAILHDIGKIGTNIAILHKPGKLEVDEYRHLQLHPETGMKILEAVPFLKDVRLRIGQHHERYDGRGYPGRLAGEDIFLEARIMAIADSYDAMTSERPYRKPLPERVARQELLDNAGSQFDPGLVPLFIEALDEGGSIGIE